VKRRVAVGGGSAEPAPFFYLDVVLGDDLGHDPHRRLLEQVLDQRLKHRTHLGAGGLGLLPTVPRVEGSKLAGRAGDREVVTEARLARQGI